MTSKICILYATKIILTELLIYNSGQTSILNVTAYYGHLHRTRFTITDQHPFDEYIINHVCDNINGGYYLPDTGNAKVEFIKYTILQNYNWTMGEFVWLNFIKFYDMWYNPANGCSRLSINNVYNNVFHSIQCAALNMSGPHHMAEVYALPCDGNYSFVCLQTLETLNLTTYIAMSVQLSDALVETNKTKNFTECIEQFETDKLLVAVVSYHNYGEEVCSLYKTSVEHLPLDITLVVYPYSDVIVKVYNESGDEVVIGSGISTIQPPYMHNTTEATNITLPCIPANTAFNVSVYPSRFARHNFTIFLEQRSWVEAQESCISQNKWFYGGGSNDLIYDYLTSRLQELNSSYEGMWIGIYKVDAQENWRRYKCGSLKSLPDNVQPHIVEYPMCLMVNMSAAYDYNIYSVLCNMSFPYLCSKKLGNFTTESTHDIYHFTHIASNFLQNSNVFENLTLGDCIFNLFDNSGSVAAEFWISNTTHGICEIYKYPAHLLPIEISLEQYIVNVTTIIVTNLTVNFDENRSTINATGVSFPDCSNPSDTTVADGTTWTVDTAFVTDTPGGATTTTLSHVCCACTTTTKSEEEVQKQIDEMKKELTLNTKTLSSYTRSKVSASDDRPSSATLGSVAIIILVFIVLLIVISDVPNFIRGIRAIQDCVLTR